MDVKKEKAASGNMSAMARFQKLDVQGKAETGKKLTIYMITCSLFSIYYFKYLLKF